MIKQFLTQGFEREILQKIDATKKVVNSKPILDSALCHNCLHKEILNWLELYPSVKKKIAKNISNYLGEVENNVQDITCACCKKNYAALCPYCFSEGVFNVLKQKKVDLMVIMDYLSTFRFDENHENYMRNLKQKEVVE